MLKSLLSLGKRHLEALWIVITVILPLIIRSGSRPVIFSRYSGIGDIICTFPAVMELKKRHPKAAFIYNCHPESTCLVRMAGISDHFTTSQHIGLVGFWYKFLLSGYYHFGRNDEDPASASRESMIMEFSRQHGVTVIDDHPRLENDPATLAKTRDLLKSLNIFEGPLVLIHPGPTWPVREWPHEFWIALVQELHSRGFKNIIRLGVSRHLTFGEAEVPEIPDVISLIDQLTLEESVALISLGDLFIGIDSGLLHIAAGVQTPAVGIWGPTLPRLHYSAANTRSFVIPHVDCHGCHHRVPRLHWITGCPFEIACMRSISPTEVLQACIAKLESADPQV